MVTSLTHACQALGIMQPMLEVADRQWPDLANHTNIMAKTAFRERNSASFNRMAFCSGGLGSGPHQHIVDLHVVGRSQAVHHSLGNVLRLQAFHLLIALAADLLVVVVADIVKLSLHHAGGDAAHTEGHLVRPRLQSGERGTAQWGSP